MAHLDTLRDVLQSSATLRELAVQAITTRKIVYAEDVNGLPGLGHVAAMPDVTLMQMITDQRKKLEPKMGRKTNASKLAEFGLLRPCFT